MQVIFGFHFRRFLTAFWLLAVAPGLQAQEQAQAPYDATVVHFVSLLVVDEPEVEESFEYIENNWERGFVTMALEVLYLSRDRERYDRLLRIMEDKTGQAFGLNSDAWYHWLWKQPAVDHKQYPAFKGALYSLIDNRFEGYFHNERASTIRLDEVRWGGVPQDGIPPLRSPKMIKATEASYLDDDNVVFGIELDGDARAYPKRILAWHEMFVDKIADIDVAGVYCTLCGTVILYKTQHDDVLHQMGTSGFLYRSNKLMYDKETQSLWNTLWGRPVIGPLVGKDIELERSFLVTTTWGEWKRRHPETTVLSPDTGHQRDYAEGAAYRDYFAVDDLMFTVPNIDTRLKNKDEVLALWFPEQSSESLAIAAAFLAKKPVHHDAIGKLEFVVLTDTSGANRVYETGDVRFERFDGDAGAFDTFGGKWRMEEKQLIAGDGRTLKRLPAHRAFWFGWYSAFEDTRLVM